MVLNSSLVTFMLLLPGEAACEPGITADPVAGSVEGWCPPAGIGLPGAHGPAIPGLVLPGEFPGEFGAQAKAPFPAPVMDAFRAVPSPSVVPTVIQLGMLPPEQRVLVPCPGTHAVFETAAHFPHPAFGPSGEPVAQGAAVIYEGMIFTSLGNGNYEVRFIVESPLTPVTLRLQFGLWENGLQRGTVTLPPVTLCPTPTVCGHPSHAWLVVHQGWSPVLARAGADCQFSVTRSGTARFGSKPDFDFFAAELD